MAEKQGRKGEVVYVSRGCDVEEFAKEIVMIVNVALHSSVSPNRDIQLLLTGRHYRERRTEHEHIVQHSRLIRYSVPSQSVKCCPRPNRSRSEVSF
jgi:hypothetical protein